MLPLSPAPRSVPSSRPAWRAPSAICLFAKLDQAGRRLVFSPQALHSVVANFLVGQGIDIVAVNLHANIRSILASTAPGPAGPFGMDFRTPILLLILMPWPPKCSGRPRHLYKYKLRCSQEHLRNIFTSLGTHMSNVNAVWTYIEASCIASLGQKANREDAAIGTTIVPFTRHDSIVSSAPARSVTSPRFFDVG